MKNARHTAKVRHPEPGASAVPPASLRAAGTGAPSSRLRARARTASLAAALLALAALAPPAAQARQARLFAGTFGAASSTTPNPYPLGSLKEGILRQSLAADSTAGPSQGDVYVTDPVNHRVEKFDSAGHFLLMFGKEVNKKAVEEHKTEAEQNVCGAEPGEECQPGAATTAPGALERPTLVAVDSSTGPSHGDVYVDTGSGMKPHNEIQQITLSSSVTGGTFTLSFEGETTAPIPFDATREEVGKALEALPSIGAGNVVVEYESNPYSFKSVWTVKFIEKLGARDVPQLTVDPSGLTPGGSTASVSTTVNGNPLIPDLITKFGEEGNLISSWGDGSACPAAANGQLSGACAPGGPFLALVGIAVDSHGNLWVVDTASTGASTGFSEAFEFDSEAKSIGGWSDTANEGREYAGLTLDSEDNLFYQAGAGLAEYTAAGTRLGTVVDPGSEGLLHEAQGFAVDPVHDELFVAVEMQENNILGPTEIQRYALSSCHPSGSANFCTPAESFGQSRVEPGIDANTGLAVDPSTPADPLYVLFRGAPAHNPPVPSQVTAFSNETVPGVATAKASGFTPGSATLNGSVEPEGVPTTHCYFEWGTTAAYGSKAPCAQGEVLGGSGRDQVSAPIAGLAPGTTYHFRLVASNAATDLAAEPQAGEDLSFGPPLIESGSALEVAATSATLQLQVNPNDVDTHARIEYGTEAGPYPEATAEVDLGAAGSSQSASLSLQGLAPHTTYHYRVLAESVLGSPEGPDLSFTTQPASAPSLLPDNRGWELVSPPDKHGAPLLGLTETGDVIQAAADGDGLAYAANGSIGAGAAGNRSPNTSELLADRAAAGGWSTANISTPYQAPTGLTAGNPSEYKLFSSDLSQGAVEPFGATPLSPQTSEKTPYLRQPDGTYTPLVTEANVRPGTQFGGEEEADRSETFNGGEPNFITANPNLQHVLVGSPKALTEEFSPGYNPTYKSLRNVYEWNAGALTLVSQIPPGSARLCGGPAPACVPASEAGRITYVGDGRTLRHAISADGSRVVFGTAHESGTKLYLRDLATGETLALDAKEAGCPSCESGGATYRDASADDTRIFFTDERRLTADSTAAPNQPDLYMCETLEGEEGQLTCKLTDLSANALHPTEPADVLGVLGAPEDGSAVYYVANGALTADATSGNCRGRSEVEPQHSCNLYRTDTATGATSLVAVLSEADGPSFGGGRIANLTARVSPDGRFLAFMSERPLTGYDNRDAVSAQRDEEVFLYHAPASAGEEGTLLCASCNPTGARPHGVQMPPITLVDGPQIWHGRWLAANVPGWTAWGLGDTLYQSRYLSNSGRLFFNSSDALVPADSNGNQDVYQYEPPTVGGCTEESPAFAARNGGCVSLISSGASPEESVFLDASESGNDVFFLTASRLTPRDIDGAYDIYDARVGGGEAEAAKPVECSGDACQQPASPPNDATPGSLTFNGAGNVHEEAPRPRCAKGKVRKGTKCVAKKHRKAHKKRARSHNRGGHR